VGLDEAGRLFREQDGERSTPTEAEGRVFRDVCVLSNGWVVTGDLDHRLRVWDGDQEIQEVWIGSVINAVIPAPVGLRVLVAVDSCSVSIWDLETETRLAKAFVCQDEALGGAWTPDGSAALGRGYASTWVLRPPVGEEWQFPGRMTVSPALTRQPSGAWAFAPDSSTLAHVGAGGRLVICDVDGSHTRALEVPQDLYSVALDGRGTAWLGGRDGWLTLDLATGTPGVFHPTEGTVWRIVATRWGVLATIGDRVARLATA